MDGLKAEVKRLNIGKGVYMGQIGCYRKNKRIWFILTGTMRLTEKDAQQDAQYMVDDLNARNVYAL